MKLKHTQAKEARRVSSFRSTGAKDTPYGSRFEKRATLGASKRALKRDHLQRKAPKTFGNKYVVCRSFEQFQDAVRGYMNLPPSFEK